MPSYLVERSFAEGLHIPMDAIGAKTCAEVVGTTSITASPGATPA